MMQTIDLLVERLGGLAPKVAMVLGSGLGGLVNEVENAVCISYAEPVLMLAGRAHYYEHGNAAAMRPVIEVLAGIGIEKLILTNAAGSVDPDMLPGSIMLIEDHINFSGSNPLFGEPSDRRFVGLTEAYDASLRAAFEKAAEVSDTILHKGVYMWFSGPSFETPAEIRMARLMGANAVGMSTVPEVILARFCGLKVAACSVITNLAAGMTGAELSHEETKDMAPIGGGRLATVLKTMFREGLVDG